MVGAPQLTDISKYLTAEMLARAFRVKTGSDDSVRSVEVTRAAAAGEGLISAVWRIHVQGDSHKATFVVKALISNLLLRKSLDCHKYFQREALFFCEILPVLIALQKSLGAKEKLQENFPMCYSCHCDGENDYILMEDMSEYDCEGMAENPSLSERDMTLKVLAHLHATSMALRVKNPDLFQRIAESIPEMYYRETRREYYFKYLQNAIEIDRVALAEYEDPKTSVYYKKFDELSSNDVYSQLQSLTSPDSSKHNAINHGDAWCPNFLVSKHRCVAVDFQLARCASPATDLAYFLMSADLCKTTTEFIEAVQVYHSALSYYLEDMGLKADKVFSYEDLQEELAKYGKFGVLACLTTIALRASDERCDVLTSESFEVNYAGADVIPLEHLWKLKPLVEEEHKLRLLHVIRTAVDLSLI